METRDNEPKAFDIIFLLLLFSIELVVIAGQCCAHVKYLFAVLREYRFVAFLLRFGIEERPRPVGFAVVFKLEGIAADENLRGAGIDNDNSLFHHYGSITYHFVNIRTNQPDDK